MIHLVSRPYLQIALNFQFKSFVFQHFHSTLGLHQSVHSGVRLGSQERDPAALLSGQLAVYSRVDPSPAGTLRAAPLSLSGPGIVIRWEKSDLELANKGQYLRMLVDTNQERFCLMNSWITRFQDVKNRFRIFYLHLQRCGSRFLDYMASLEQFIPRGRARMYTLLWQFNIHLSASADGLVMSVSMTECFLCFRW